MKVEETKPPRKRRLEIPPSCACARRFREPKIVLPYCSIEEIEVRATTVSAVLLEILTRPLPRPA